MQRSRTPLHALAAAAALLAGCVAPGAGAVMMGMSLLGAVVGGGGGGGASGGLVIDPNKAMSDSLARSMRGVHPRCLATLDAMQGETPAKAAALAPGQCRVTPVCLAGMDRPLAMSVCAAGGGEAAALARGPAGRDRAGAAAWTWEDGG